MPFLGIAVPYFTFWYYLCHPAIKKQKLGWEWACETKKGLIIISNDFKKQPVINQILTVLSFSFLIDCCISAFPLSLSKNLLILIKLISFHKQTFIVYKNQENLKMLMEIFCQELIASNVILVLLDHLNSKIFFVGQPWWPT